MFLDIPKSSLDIKKKSWYMITRNGLELSIIKRVKQGHLQNPYLKGTENPDIVNQ